MAISGGDGSIVLTTNVDQSGLKKGLGSMKKLGATAGKAFLAIGAAAATATVAVTKMAVSAYADYEQLVGGVETLFKGSAKKVVDYANDAFATAGMSANQYMEQVIGISAMLIKSTGDTEKAADVANMAITDMADNVNKMGTDMTRVQMAYQGFARQQYVLLDNLAIGYGGTKQEMERLLRDAQAITGIKYDINNLADVYSAIHAIQEELGITGTTAKEAEKTITGSANMMKAAWQNVLSAISGGGDLDKAINNLVYSIQKYFENIVPVVERSLQGIGQLIERVAPMLVQTIARALIKAIPSLLNAVYQMIIGLAKGIYQGIIDLFKGGTKKVLEAQTNEIAQSVENQNALTEAVEETEKAQKGALAGFDEINTLSKDTAENQELLDAIGSNGGANIPLNIETEEPEKELSALGKAFEKIGKKIQKAFEPLTKISFKNLGKSLSGLVQPMKKLGLIAWGNLESAIEKVIAPLGEIVIEDVLPRFFDTFSIAIDGFRVILDNGWDIFEQFIDEFLKPIWEYAEPKILEVWDNLNTKLKDFVKLVEESEAWQDFQTIMSAIYDVLEPLVEDIIDFITPIIEFKMNSAFTDLELVFKSIEDIIGAIAALINGDFDDAWQHLKDLFLDNFVDYGKKKFQAFSDVIEGITGFDLAQWVQDTWENVKTFWTEHIAPIFTKKWWEDLGKTCMNGLISGFESGINGIIWAFESMINWIVDGLNKIQIKLPDWAGGYSFGVNIPRASLGRVSIPRLAQGAVIPPNREFLAVLGDQKHGTNIEAPLDTIVEAFNIALTNNRGNVSQDNRPIILQVDSREIARATRTGEEKLGAQTVFGGFANAY